MTQHRIGIIGLGAAITKHARALATLTDRATVAACFSPTASRRAAFAAAHSMPVVDSLDAVFGDRSIDLVLILTPPWSHLDLVQRCCAAGKHVLLEKPIEATVERSHRVVADCAAAGVRLGVVFQNRHRAPHQRLRGLLRDGALGRLLSVSTTVRWWRPDTYFDGKRTTKAHDGGGVLLTQAIHALDQLVDLAGAPIEVRGFAVNSNMRPIDTEDVVAASFRWENGAIGTLDATTTAFPGEPERIALAGTDGSAILERTRLRVWLKDGTTLDETEDASDPAVHGDFAAHQRLIVDMLDALDAGRDPLTSGTSALPVHDLIAAVLRAGGMEP